MRVQQIHFNHDPTSASHDAINLIHAGNGDLGLPEWSDGLMRRPVAYAKSEISLPVARFCVIPSPSDPMSWRRKSENGW